MVLELFNNNCFHTMKKNITICSPNSSCRLNDRNLEIVPAKTDGGFFDLLEVSVKGISIKL